jgi:hypothetical protein
MSHAHVSQLDHDQNNKKKSQEGREVFYPMFSDDIGHLLKNDDDHFRSKRCVHIYGHARESSIENHAQPLVDSISPPIFFIFYLKRNREREKKKNLITK